MKRFPQIDLERALGAVDAPIHIIERDGQGEAAVWRIYPLNIAADVGRPDYTDRQGMTLDKYLEQIPDMVEVMQALWSPVLLEGQGQTAYRTPIPVAAGVIHIYESTVYRVEWTAEYAQAVIIGRNVTDEQQTLIELQAATENLSIQAQVIEELSVPIVALWDGVLGVSIVGAVDSHRATQLTEALLTAITNERAAFAIIDITGVPVVDTQVANYLIQAMRAATLLGCRSILVGIGPEIAQTIVQLGVNLDAITTARSMQVGLHIALGSLGYRVSRA